MSDKTPSGDYQGMSSTLIRSRQLASARWRQTRQQLRSRLGFWRKQNERNGLLNSPEVKLQSVKSECLELRGYRHVSPCCYPRNFPQCAYRSPRAATMHAYGPRQIATVGILQRSKGDIAFNIEGLVDSRDSYTSKQKPKLTKSRFTRPLRAGLTSRSRCRFR